MNENKFNLYKLTNDAIRGFITCHMNLSDDEAKLVEEVFNVLNKRGARLQIKKEPFPGDTFLPM